MPGTSSAKTRFALLPGHDELVGQRDFLVSSQQLLADLPDKQITQHRVQPSREKYFCFHLTQITGLFSPVPRPLRGAYRDRHGRWVWDAMAATASGAKAPGEALVADGEVVWF
jgi:hypothetical protein